MCCLCTDSGWQLQCSHSRLLYPHVGSQSRWAEEQLSKWTQGSLLSMYQITLLCLRSVDIYNQTKIHKSVDFGDHNSKYIWVKSSNSGMQFPIQFSLGGSTCSVVCWTQASKDRAKMAYLKTHVMVHLFVLALFPRVFPTTTTSTSATPINTCRPPAIEDLQESKQDPEGHWTPDHSTHEQPWHEASDF